MPETVASLIARALVAFDALSVTADAVPDEAQYVADLSVVWRARLDAVATDRGGQVAAPEVTTAVEAAIAECGAVADPHQAIDWLSTLPQIVLLALGEAT